MSRYTGLHHYMSVISHQTCFWWFLTKAPIHSFIHSCLSYVSNVCQMPGIVLGTKATAVNKTHKSFPVIMEEDTQRNKQMKYIVCHMAISTREKNKAGVLKECFRKAGR